MNNVKACYKWNRIFYISISAIIFLSSVRGVYSQEENFLTSTPEIYPNNLELRQNEGVLDVSFQANNRHSEDVDNIYYGVQLFNLGKELTDIVVDEVVYREAPFSLDKYGSDEDTKNITFPYSLPQNLLGGTYVLRVTLLNSNMDKYGWDDVEVELESNVDTWINFSEDSDISVLYDGEAFGLQSGVNVNSGDNLTLSMNLSLMGEDSSIVTYPYLKIFQKNVGNGDSVFEKYYIENLFLLDSGTAREFNFEFPIPIDAPGAYEGLFYLVNDEKERVSEEVKVRLVIPGASARILSVFADKGYYNKGDTALINVEFATSADATSPELSYAEYRQMSSNAEADTVGTSLSDISMFVQVFDGSGNMCGNAETLIDEEMSSGSTITDEMQVQIVRKCLSPVVEFTIYEGENLLDSSRVVIETPEEIIEANNKLVIIGAAVAVSVLISVGGFSYMYFKRMKTRKGEQNGN